MMDADETFSGVRAPFEEDEEATAEARDGQE